MPWPWWLLACVGALLVGVVVGLWVRSADGRRWQRMAVEMARMNDELMNRIEALESERQKEVE